MRISNIVLQLSGITLACLKEDHITHSILEDIRERGIELSDSDDVKVYINLEGTSVNAYYTVNGEQSGMKQLQ